MHKKILALFLCLCAGFLLTGCYENDIITTEPEQNSLIIFSDTSISTEPEPETETEQETITETESQVFAPSEDEELPASVEKNGSYTSPEDVAEYIHTFGTLPDNFITKKQAQALGWDSSKGNLWDVAPDMSIGGDYFGNYEKLLPDDTYHECDVNYAGGYRGAERIIYSDNGSIYYTDDHYQTFTQLY